MRTKASLALLTTLSTVSLSLQHSAYEATARFLGHQLEMYKPGMTSQTQQELFDLQYRCSYMSGIDFYNLKPLANEKRIHEFDGVLNTYYVSFCNDINDATKSCNANTMVASYLVGSQQCQALSGSNPSSDADFDESDGGIKITYKSPSQRPGECQNEPAFMIHVNCDKNQGTVQGVVVDELTNKCYTQVSFNHKAGCKIGQLSALWSWMNNNKWAMFVVFLLVGTVVCFLGRTLFKPVLFIAGVLLSVSLVWIIFYSTFLNESTQTWVGWVVLAGSILFGLIIGCLFVKLVKLGAFVLAAWGGFALSLLIYNAFLYKMNSNVGFWCFTVGVALAFGILALFFFDHILIHSTALAGSFLAINGIGLVAGHYQNPFTIADEINHGVIDKIDPIFYAYLAGNFVLYVLGALFQYRQRRGDKVNGRDPYERLR